MSGELQTIPARHGVATFVPRGRTIKIINTYGKQVVSTWAFSLPKPPDKKDEDSEEEGDVKDGEEDVKEAEKEIEDLKEAEEVKNEVEREEDRAREEADDPPEVPPGETADGPPQKETETTDNKQPQKRTWSSYLPSIPYRNKGKAPNTKPDSETQKAEKAQNEANSKKWSSYLPTGKGFSSYVPNVQVPNKQEVISAFNASHYRDPNKSYAEQLYDFSKTPVGAGGLSFASGSGYASSMYAAYSAYTKANPRHSDQPPMEYMSLPHTRASSHKLVPALEDTLLTNLRQPILTLVEDSTPGAHDTLTAACDANLYTALGVDKPEEHGSCAENLVLALKELNEKAGLKGTKAIGADITVNIAPTPLHLFMNAPIEMDPSVQSNGSGAKGTTVKVEEPKGKKRGFVRFKAERDVVVVMSACPMDVGSQNGGKCMAANFVVEEAGEENMDKSTASVKDTKKAAPSKQTPSKKGGDTSKPMPTPKGGPAKFANVKKQPEARKDSKTEEAKPATFEEEKKPAAGTEGSPKPKKKPKKLERRSTSTANAAVTPTKS